MVLGLPVIGWASTPMDEAFLTDKSSVVECPRATAGVATLFASRLPPRRSSLPWRRSAPSARVEASG